MSDFRMKEYVNYLIEKPFACNVDGCSMKFTNEDHLNVHKKRHDMTLSLGLGLKGTTFADQTPTPTQFIRNCEEVGLFQDLQNVNPFEETFKKAVEAVKSGQPLHTDKLLPSNPSDDTLHTPNVFPHITDVTTLNHPDSCSRPENIPPCEDALMKQSIPVSEKLSGSDLTCDPSIQQTTIKQSLSSSSSSSSSLSTSSTSSSSLSESAIPLDNNNSTENQSIKDKVILNVPEGHFVQLITPQTAQSSCNMVVIKNSEVYPSVPITVKEKLKKSLSDSKTEKFIQEKVPILKCPSKQTTNSLSNKFSKFSKNALKLMSKLENPGSNEISNAILKKSKKGDKFQSKEARSEFLARSRAASSRCREKKKMYVLYLEKVNSELSTANQNLQLINTLLRKEICDLHAELLKHKNCSVADKHTEATLSAVASFIGEPILIEKEKPPITTPHQEDPVDEVSEMCTSETVELSQGAFTQFDPNSLLLDVAEVIVNDGSEDHEIPLNDRNKPPDIIVRFNSGGNDFPVKPPSDLFLDKYIEVAGSKVKQIYLEHSYYLKKPADFDHRIMNYKTFRETLESVAPISSDGCKQLENLGLKKSDAFKDITSLNTKVLLEPRTPPPLLLLKPFKKRTLQSKPTEKT